MFLAIVATTVVILVYQNNQLKKEIAYVKNRQVYTQEVAETTPSLSDSSTTQTNITLINSTRDYADTVSRKAQFSDCYNNIYETTRKTCVAETDFDPGSANGSGATDWLNLSDEEKRRVVNFWVCYDRVSIQHSQQCEKDYTDVAKMRDAYYDCLAHGVDIPKYCADETGYTEANRFPTDKESSYWECIGDVRIEKENNCQQETGYSTK